MTELERLTPLRIPGGWCVSYNKLSVLEPEDIPEQDPAWLDFTEDILQLETSMSRTWDGRKEEQTLILDLGWYPDSDPAGTFRLLAVLDRDWEFPLLEFSSRSKTAVVETLEDWLLREFMPPGFIERETWYKNHPRCRSKDPFYSESNMRYLAEQIADIKSGKAKLIEHDLIDE